MDKSEIKRSLVEKMLSRRVIGHHHMRVETLMRCGWKSHEKGLVKEVIHDCLNEGILIWVKKSKKALTLNVDRIKEIKLQFRGG